MHHRHPVGDLGDHPEVVGDEQHTGVMARLQGFDEVENLRLGGDVEGGRRLVGDQQHRVQDQGHGDHDALALATRQLVRIGAINTGRVGQLDIVHDVDDLAAARLRRQIGVGA